MDLNKKTFIIYIATITLEITIDLVCNAQITLLKVKKAFFTILAEYFDFANVFSKNLVAVLSEFTQINTHTINPKESKQRLYEFIYSVGLSELETSKPYIKTNLANNFIYLFKSLTSALILFN